MKAQRIYYYQGMVERGGYWGYRWYDGYADLGESGKPTQPWRTFRECQEEAKRDGVKAVFVRDFV